MSCQVGLLNSVPSPLLCEMIGAAGYQFVILDLEHVLVSPSDLQHCIRACELGGCEAWVRVPEADAKLIGRVLDAGARGVVLPQVESADTVRRAVAAAHFPPFGKRGITGGRVTGFGRVPLTDYIAQSRDSIRVVAMIESRAGLEALPQILAVPGLSLILEGALDLALDLNLGPQPLHSRVWDALLEMAALCDSVGIPFCANPRTPEQRTYWLGRDPRWLLAGEDRGLLLAALRERRRELQISLQP
ncbi:HpcH/HpaI aldolase family protein [Dyella sp.]|uniref:HpcH/HpaI aldolase family protein n=1 Tax=Dyella sp. TaxID=1869338 RepID=UPI002ED5293B